MYVNVAKNTPVIMTNAGYSIVLLSSLATSRSAISKSFFDINGNARYSVTYPATSEYMSFFKWTRTFFSDVSPLKNYFSDFVIYVPNETVESYPIPAIPLTEVINPQISKLDDTLYQLIFWTNIKDTNLLVYEPNTQTYKYDPYNTFSLVDSYYKPIKVTYPRSMSYCCTATLHLERLCNNTDYGCCLFPVVKKIVMFTQTNILASDQATRFPLDFVPIIIKSNQSNTGIYGVEIYENGFEEATTGSGDVIGLEACLGQAIPNGTYAFAVRSSITITDGVVYNEGELEE